MEHPYGATILVRGAPQGSRRWHVAPAAGAFDGALYGARILVKGAPLWARRRHATPAAGAFEGVPYGATILVMVLAAMGAAVACDPCHWGLRWSSLWGRDPREGCAKMGIYERRELMRTWPLGPSVELPMGPRTV